MKDAKGHGSNPRGAHQDGINDLGHHASANERVHGKTLPELGWPLKNANIWRAMNAKGDSFNPMDYVTRNEKFAREHAEHMTVTEGEPFHVVKLRAKAEHVAEAYNPGEYFYTGPKAKGAIQK